MKCKLPPSHFKEIRTEFSAQIPGTHQGKGLSPDLQHNTWLADAKQSFQNACHMSFKKATINASQNWNKWESWSTLNVQPKEINLSLTLLHHTLQAQCVFLDGAFIMLFGRLGINLLCLDYLLPPPPVSSEVPFTTTVPEWLAAVHCGVANLYHVCFALPVNEFGVLCVHCKLLFYIWLVIYDNDRQWCSLC